MASGLVCCGKTLESDREKSQRLVSKRTKDTILKPVMDPFGAHPVCHCVASPASLCVPS